MSATKTGWKATDGTNIFACYWAPEGNAKAVVLQVHGLGEHSGRYDHVAELLNRNDIALFAYDHRGHGRSEGQRGHIPNYEVMMEETDQAIQEAKKVFPDVPLILYGHSWGGNIAANYLIRRQPDVQGALLTGAWFRLTKPPGAFTVGLARLVNSIWPNLSQDNGLKAAHLSHNTDVVKAYEDDPLVHSRLTPRLFISSMEAGEYAIVNAEKVQVPVLIMHGADDMITSPGGAGAFHQNIVGRKGLKVYEGMYHEIHNEVENSLVLADMLEFFKSLL